MLRVFIRHNLTGEIRLHTDEYDWASGYIWEEGNYACDCNRHLFFHRAAGHEPEEDCACGHERYSILAIENGRIVRDEYGLVSPQ